MKVRQDAWSHEEDLLLAETVLRHIREGSTQLNAFDEVGDNLNRTSAACGFRWNAEVRQKYDQAMEIAKKQRKERKRALAQQSQQFKPVQTEQQQTSRFGNKMDNTSQNYYNQEQTLTRQVEAQFGTKEEIASEINLESVISYLHSFRNEGINSQILQSENARLTRENKQLNEEKDRLERKLLRLKQENSIVQEDYQALVQIMDRARRMVSFTDEEIRKPQEYPVNTNDELDLGQIAK